MTGMLNFFIVIMLVYYMSKSVFVVVVLSLCHYFLLFNILFIR